PRFRVPAAHERPRRAPRRALTDSPAVRGVLLARRHPAPLGWMPAARAAGAIPSSLAGRSASVRDARPSHLREPRMSVGLLAVVDDILSAAMKASAKAAGVVIDDAAVTPQYVQGLTPARELPVVGRIALGSLVNKFLIIIPIALVLTAFAPWVLPYLLILGGTYLCFEGAE